MRALERGWGLLHGSLGIKGDGNLFTQPEAQTATEIAKGGSTRLPGESRNKKYQMKMLHWLRIFRSPSPIETNDDIYLLLCKQSWSHTLV
jgi:hypothetical protein